MVEGAKLVAEAVKSDLVVFEAYAEGDWAPPADFAALLEADDVEITAVSTRGIERIASTNSPQPVVAEVKMPSAAWTDLACLLYTSPSPRDS